MGPSAGRPALRGPTPRKRERFLKAMTLSSQTSLVSICVRPLGFWMLGSQLFLNNQLWPENEMSMLLPPETTHLFSLTHPL